jgi:hypothetical protein
MSKLEFLKMVYGYLKNPNIESLNLSMDDTHHNGIFSLVINGTEFGKLTRVFIADTELLPYEVQLHTHRYPLRITTIKGNITHITAVESFDNNFNNVELSEFEYKSPLNGGGGLKYIGERKVTLKEYALPVGATIEMSNTQYHTMSCSKGSIWIVEEQGFALDYSKVLGVPFITEGLYNPPAPFQVNDKCQLVAKEIKKLILDYELVS